MYVNSVSSSFANHCYLKLHVLTLNTDVLCPFLRHVCYRYSLTFLHNTNVLIAFVELSVRHFKISIGLCWFVIKFFKYIIMKNMYTCDLQLNY
jgi:hypothetical protein